MRVRRLPAPGSPPQGRIVGRIARALNTAVTGAAPTTGMHLLVAPGRCGPVRARGWQSPPAVGGRMRRDMAVITVSRQPGSLGDQLAEVVARRLDYRLVGRQELVRLAAGVGEPDPSLERSPELRERSPSFWERLNEERRRFSSLLHNVVLHLAEQDDVVIVGLGAGQLLKEFHHVLRLQVVAPLDLRIERVMESGLDDAPSRLRREQARDLVRHRDRDGAGYMRYLFHIDWMDP